MQLENLQSRQKKYLTSVAARAFGAEQFAKQKKEIRK